MSEVIKDAPCLCKDDEMERIQPKRNFFQRLLYKRLQRKYKRYPYPVLYSDGVISNAICDRIGRKPLGVVFENHLITLRASSKRMKWDEAMDYCKSVKIFGQSCEAGTIEFWKKYLIEEESGFIYKTLLSLGGNKVHEWHWSSSGTIFFAWIFWAGNGANYDDMDTNDKDDHFAVRPVLDFSKLPPEVAARFVWLT